MIQSLHTFQWKLFLFFFRFETFFYPKIRFFFPQKSKGTRRWIVKDTWCKLLKLHFKSTPFNFMASEKAAKTTTMPFFPPSVLSSTCEVQPFHYQGGNGFMRVLCGAVSQCRSPCTCEPRGCCWRYAACWPSHREGARTQRYGRHAAGSLAPGSTHRNTQIRSPLRTREVRREQLDGLTIHHLRNLYPKWHTVHLQMLC